MLCPHKVGKQREATLARLEIGHPGEQRVALLDDLDEVLVDIHRVPTRGDVAVDAGRPTIGGQAELPFIGRGFRISRAEVSA